MAQTPSPCSIAFAGEYESPLAAATTVLVVGATGRVGRVLVRKLVRGWCLFPRWLVCLSGWVVKARRLSFGQLQGSRPCWRQHMTVFARPGQAPLQPLLV